MLLKLGSLPHIHVFHIGFFFVFVFFVSTKFHIKGENLSLLSEFFVGLIFTSGYAWLVPVLYVTVHAKTNYMCISRPK